MNHGRIKEVKARNSIGFKFTPQRKQEQFSKRERWIMKRVWRTRHLQKRIS